MENQARLPEICLNNQSFQNLNLEVYPTLHSQGPYCHRGMPQNHVQVDLFKIKTILSLTIVTMWSLHALPDTRQFTFQPTVKAYVFLQTF